MAVLSQSGKIGSQDLFEGCTPEQMARIEARILEKVYRNGETIVTQGQSFPVVGKILEGLAVVSDGREDGSEAILAFLLPTDLIGVPQEVPAMFNITAAGTVRLSCMSLQDFMQIIQTTPVVAFNAMSRALDRLEAVQDWIVRANQLDARSRLISLIALMGLRHVQAGLSSVNKPISLKIPVSRERIGNLLGLGLYTVSRLMGELKSDDLIQFDGPHLIQIPDLAKLLDLCGCDLDALERVNPLDAHPAAERLMAPL